LALLEFWDQNDTDCLIALKYKHLKKIGNFYYYFSFAPTYIYFLINISVHCYAIYIEINIWFGYSLISAVASSTKQCRDKDCVFLQAAFDGLRKSSLQQEE